MSLPNTCWQYAQDLESTVAVDEQRLSEGDGPSLRCYFEGTFYDVGDSWLPDINATCNTCSCMVSSHVTLTSRHRIILFAINSIR